MHDTKQIHTNNFGTKHAGGVQIERVTGIMKPDGTFHSMAKQKLIITPVQMRS